MNRYKISEQDITKVLALLKNPQHPLKMPNWYKKHKEDITQKKGELYYQDKRIIPKEKVNSVLRDLFYSKTSTTPWARDSGYADIRTKYIGISKRTFADFAQTQRVKIRTDNVPKRVERKGNKVHKKGIIEMDLFQISKKDLPTTIKGKLPNTLKKNPQGFVLTMVDKLTSLTFLHYLGFPKGPNDQVKSRRKVEPHMRKGIKWFSEKLNIAVASMRFNRDAGGEFPPVSELPGLVVKLGPAVEARNSFAQRVLHRLMAAKRGDVGECTKQAQDILNNTKSRISKVTPNEAAEKQASEVAERYNKKRAVKKVSHEKPLKVGDMVRIVTKSKKALMYKAYQGRQFSTEKFRILEVGKSKPYRYKLRLFKLVKKKRVPYTAWKYRDQISNAEKPTDKKSEAILSKLTATGKVKAIPQPRKKKPAAQVQAPVPRRRSRRGVTRVDYSKMGGKMGNKKVLQL